jgi:hypothetical protein
MADQLSREAALARLAEIENEIERLSAQPDEGEEQRRIAMATAAARAGGGGFITPPLQPEDFTSKELAPAALRYGVPLAAGLATGPVAGLAALARTAAITGGAAGLGEAGAQTVERVAEDKEYRPGEIAGATIRGAAPLISRAPIKTILAAGGAGVAGGAAEGKTGGMEMAGEFVKSAAPVGFLQGLSSVLGANRARLSGGISRSEQIEKIAPGKITATFGQAFPEFAGLQSRIESQTGSQELANQLLDQSKVVADAVRNITGMPAESHSKLVSRIAQTFGGLSPETGARLANEAQNVNDAFAAVERARSEAQKSLAQDALAEAQQAFQRAVDVETLKGGIRGGGVRQYQPATMGAEVEDVIQSTKKAFTDRSAELYKPVKQFENTPAFDLGLPAGQNVGSVEDEILGLLNKYPALKTGDQSRVFTPYLRKLEEILASKTPASLNDLRAIRDQLYDASDVAGQAFGTAAKTDIRNVAKRITQTIDFQAPYFLGQPEALALKEANAFYSQFRPRFDEFGVVQAFKPGTMETGQMAEMFTGRVARQGTETPGFANPYTLLQDLRKANVANVPAPERLADITRSGIVDRSIDPVTGDVDLLKLAGDLNTISKQGGGGLQQLGFGTKQELDRFVQYVQKLDPAQAKGPEAVLELLKTGTPAGFAVASRAVRTLPDLATVDSVIRTLEKQAVAGSKVAENTLLNIRAREIENILLEASTSGPKPNLGSLIELTDQEMREKAALILGPKIIKTIDDQFLPGFRVMERAREAAGMAGSTVRGAALERVGRAALEAPAQIATGDVIKPAVNVFSKLASAIGYGYYSKILAKGAGVSGLKERKELYGFLKKIADAPQPQQIQLARRYLGEEDSAE